MVMSQISLRFLSTTVVWIWNGPTLLRGFDARKRSRVGAVLPRCRAFPASRLSMLMPMAQAPASLSLRNFGRDKRAVAAEHRAQTARRRVSDQLNVVTHKRLTATSKIMI